MVTDHTLFDVEFSKGPVSDTPPEFFVPCPDCGEAIQQIRVIYCTPDPIERGVITDRGGRTRGLFLGLPCGCVFLHYEARRMVR